MTARQVYEAVLVEMNKVQAPSLLLEDFNYLFNKAINLYINKRYNIYDVNQQTTDDLRVLKSSVTLRALNTKSPVTDVTVKDSLYGAIYEFVLPNDYLHLLNCICNYRVNKPFKCYNANTYVLFPAQRLTSDMWSQIINNFYMRPSYKRPYYFIHNVNTSVPHDDTWNLSEPNPWKSGVKINFKTDMGFGRVPSSRTMIPTDPGNIDIQHLERTDINSRYNDLYVDDANHYDETYEYGIPRTMKFDNYEVTSNGGKWIRTGYAKIYGTGTKYKFENGLEVDYQVPNMTVGFVSFNVVMRNKDTQDEVLSGDLLSTFNRADLYLVPDDNSQKIADLRGYFLRTKAAVGLQIPAEYKDQIYTSTSTTPRYNADGSTKDENENVKITNLTLKYQWEPKNVTTFDAVERVGEVRYGNPSTVRLEIRYGKDNSLFTLDSVYVDYIKAPQNIRITQEQLDLTEDTSQIMEFPDYVIQEIINELVHIVMENSSDPRLQSHVPISLSIANPAQQLEAPQSRRG